MPAGWIAPSSLGTSWHQKAALPQLHLLKVLFIALTPD